MTAPIRQRVPLPVSVERDNGRRMAVGRNQDHTGATAGTLTAKARQVEYCLTSRAAAMPFAGLCDAVAPWADGPAVSPADVAMHDDVAVVRMRGELDASVLHDYLSDIWWHALAVSVVDLAELAFIDCACLGVLVRYCKQIRHQGGSFALAGPQPAVRTVLAATGLLTWFEVHDTVKEAVADAGTQRSPEFPAYPAQPQIKHVIIAGVRDPTTSVIGLAPREEAGMINMSGSTSA
jgi:anti-anti-sigma factor